MSAPLNFRSAFNGFNREDVVRYIEFISARHTGEINQLNSQIEYLKSKASAAPAADDSQTEALNARIDSLLERCAQLEDEAVMAQLEAEEKLQASQARCAELEKQLEAVQAKAAEGSRQAAMEQELEAYRRAERAERMAQERAERTDRSAKEAADRTRKQAEDYAKQLCDQANGILAEATAKADSAAAEVSTLTDQAMLQLTQLQTALTGSKKSLRDAAAALFAIRTND